MRTKIIYHDYLTIEELDKLFLAVDKIKIETIFKIGIDTGIRVNDFALIEIIKVNLENRTIQFWQQKKRNNHTVVIEPETATLIKKYLNTIPKNQRYLFENPHRKKPYSHLFYEYQLQYWCKKIGIDEHVSWHMLRRTYKNLSKKAKRDIEAVAKQLDDKISTLQLYYSKVNKEDRIKESNKSIFHLRGDNQ